MRGFLNFSRLFTIVQTIRIFLFCQLFLTFFIVPAEASVQEQLKSTPEDPVFLHGHSYIPQMEKTQEKTAAQEDKQDIPVDEEEKVSEKETPAKEKASTPNIEQILLITFLVGILLVYRMSVKRGKQSP